MRDAARPRDTGAHRDVPGLIAERKEASEIITALRKKQSEIRDAFNAKWQVGAARGRRLGGLGAPVLSGGCAYLAQGTQRQPEGSARTARGLGVLPADECAPQLGAWRQALFDSM